MEVAIYFYNGNVAYFKGVTDLKNQDGTIEFNYFGVASQKHKKAQFAQEHIAGITSSID